MKYIFVIQAYDEKGEDNRLIDVVTLELYALNYKEALKRAKVIVKKKMYRLSSVIEEKK